MTYSITWIEESDRENAWQEFITKDKEAYLEMLQELIIDDDFLKIIVQQDGKETMNFSRAVGSSLVKRDNLK